MKKKSLFLLTLLAIASIFLVACSSAKFKDEKTANISGYDLKTDNVLVDSDILSVGFEWKKTGASSDSMKQETFGSTGILFEARQKGKVLDSTDEGSLNLGEEVYTDSFHSINAKFKLENKEDDVTVTAYSTSGYGEEDKFVIKLK